MLQKKETNTETPLNDVQCNSFSIENTHNINDELDSSVDENMKKNYADQVTQTDDPILNTMLFSLITIIPNNFEIDEILTNEQFTLPPLSQSFDSLVTSTINEALLPYEQPPPPPPSFISIKPSTKPFSTSPRDAEKRQANDDSSSADTPRNKRKKPNVTGNDIYKGGPLVPDGPYLATDSELEEYYKLVSKHVVCCIDHKYIQKLQCFRFQDEENKFICYDCAKLFSRKDISDWSIGIDFTGIDLYQCTRLSHARPIWFYIKDVKDNNICVVSKTCQYCKLYSKYSQLVRNK